MRAAVQPGPFDSVTGTSRLVIRSAWTVVPPSRWNGPFFVADSSKGVSHGAWRLTALTSTSRVSVFSAPFGIRSVILSSV